MIDIFLSQESEKKMLLTDFPMINHWLTID